MDKLRNPFSKSNSYRRKPLITLLEPRILLDGAAVSTSAEMATDVAYQQDQVHNDVSENKEVPSEVAPTHENNKDQRREVAFVDSRITDYQILIDELEGNVEVYLIDNSEAGLMTMAGLLEDQSDIDAIHIYSHGTEGEIRLGSSIITSESIENYTSELEQIGNSLTENGDIFLYGCDVGKDEAGKDLVNRVAELTNGDVAASDDITGAAALGGDWELEYQTGVVEGDALAVDSYQNKLGVVQVSVFSFPNLNGSDTSPGSSNENANLASIVQSIINGGGNYSLDTSIQSFNDPDLKAKLNGSGFFFMTDMESGNPDDPSFLPDSAKTIIRDWVSDGGVILMTGTSGSNDTNFLNTIFGWDLTTQSSSSWSINAANAAGTPFEEGPSSLSRLSATDSISKGNVENFTTIYGTDDNATLATIGYGSGTVIFLGFDYFSTGISGTGFTDTATQYGADVSTGSQSTNVWVTEIIPRALEYSASLAGSGDVDEDTTYTFAEDAFQSGGNTNFSQIKITSLPTASEGILKLSGSEVSLNQVITQSDYANLTFTPAENFNGEVTFTWQGDDEGYGADTDYSITVSAVNDAPIFSGVIPGVEQIVETDSALSDSGKFTVSDVDTSDVVTLTQTVSAAQQNSSGGVISSSSSEPDNAILKAMLSAIPSPALTNSETTKELTWTFNSGSEAFNYLKSGEKLVLTYVLTADDGKGGSDTQDITITIIGSNDAPNISPVTVNLVDTSAADSFSPLTGTISASDLDKDSLSYAIKDGENSVTTFTGLYGSLTIDSSTGAYTYDPDDIAINALTENTTDSFTISVHDGTKEVTQTFKVTISAVNDTPLITVGSGSDVNYTENASAITVGAGVTLSDADNSGLQSAAVSITAGLTSGDLLAFDNNDAELYGSITASFEAGVLTLAGASTVAQYQNALRAVTYSSSSDDPTEVNASGSVSRTLSWSINDGAVDSALGTSQINITAVNDTPDVTDATETLEDTAGADIFATISGSVTASDRENDSLTYAIKSNAGSVTTLAGLYGTLTINNATGVYSYNPDEAAVNALDGDTADTFTLQVSDGDKTSELTLTVDITAQAEATAEYTEQADAETILQNAVIATDPTLSYASGSIEFSINSSVASETIGLITAQSASVFAGAVTVVGNKVYLGDGDSANIIGSIDETSNGENGQSLKINFSADIDGDPSVLQSLARQVTYHNSSDLTANNDKIDRVITITTTADDGTTNAASQALSVIEVNDVPVATDNIDIAIEAGGDNNRISGSIAESIHPVLSDDTDVDSGDVVVLTQIANLDASFAVDSEVVTIAGIYGTLTINSAGDYTYVIDDNHPDVQALRISGQQLADTFTYTIADLAGATATAEITISIDGRNDQPVASATNIDEKWNFGKDYTRDISGLFSDVDGNNHGEDLDFQIAGLPEGISFDAETGVISGTPKDIGKFTVTMTAVDVLGATVTRTYLLEILAPPKEEATNQQSDGQESAAPEVDNIQVSNQFPGMPEGLVEQGSVRESGFIGSSGPDTGEAVEFEAENTELEYDEGSQQDPSLADLPGSMSDQVVLFAKGNTQVVSITDSDGRQSLRASVDINVNNAGEVVFTDAQQQGLDVVSMTVSLTNTHSSHSLTMLLHDNNAQSVQTYFGSLGDGSAMPSWIEVDPATGNLTMTPPEGQNDIVVRIHAIDKDGLTRTLELKLEINELLKIPTEAAEAPADNRFVLLADQLAGKDTLREEAESLIAELKSL